MKAIKVINLVKKFLNITFALFTCLAFSLIIMYRTSGVYGGMMWAWTDIEKMFGDILVFSLLAAVIVTLTDIVPKVPSIVKYIVKFGLVYAAFWFWMLDGETVSGSQRLIMSTVYVCVYAVIAVLGAILRFAEKKLAASGNEYQSVYSETEKDGENGTKTKNDGNKKK